MTCKEMVMKAVKNATKARGNVKVDDEKLDILMEYCDAISMLAKQIEGNVVDSVVDLRKGLVVIRIKVDEMIIYKNNDVFYDLAERAVALDFSNGDEEDTMYADFVFPSVWSENE